MGTEVQVEDGSSNGSGRGFTVTVRGYSEVASARKFAAFWFIKLGEIMTDGSFTRGKLRSGLIW